MDVSAFSAHAGRSIRELRALLSDAGVDTSKCLEKSDLVALAEKHVHVKVASSVCTATQSTSSSEDRCPPGGPYRSNCRRPCCIKPVYNSEEEDEDDNDDEDTGAGTSTPAVENHGEPVAKRQRLAEASIDAFLAADPAAPDLELLKKKLQQRNERVGLNKVPGRHMWQRSNGQSVMSRREGNALIHQCALAEDYDAVRDDARLLREPWLATEKYDGIRAIWDPREGGFKGRNGTLINRAPPSLLASIPRRGSNNP